MLDRVTGLQVFARVARLGSFTGAARALGMSASMATKHVDALEDRLGAQLLVRTTRRLTLTEAGSRFLASAEAILAELDEAEAAATGDTTDARGVLRLSAPVSFGVREVVPALAEFAEQHPALVIDVGFSDQYVDLVKEGWDLALRIGTLRDSALVARKLAPVGLTLVASREYLDRRGHPRCIADLAGHTCLGYTLRADGRTDIWYFGANGEIAQPVGGNLNANNGDALTAAARAGRGIALQPTPVVADDLRAGTLVALRLEAEPTPAGHVHAVYAPSRHVPAKVRALIDFLARRWAGTPPWDQGLDRL